MLQLEDIWSLYINIININTIMISTLDKGHVSMWFGAWQASGLVKIKRPHDPPLPVLLLDWFLQFNSIDWWTIQKTMCKPGLFDKAALVITAGTAAAVILKQSWTTHDKWCIKKTGDWMTNHHKDSDRPCGLHSGAGGRTWKAGIWCVHICKLNVWISPWGRVSGMVRLRTLPIPTWNHQNDLW